MLAAADGEFRRLQMPECLGGALQWDTERTVTWGGCRTLPPSHGDFTRTGGSGKQNEQGTSVLVSQGFSPKGMLSTAV